MVIALILSKSIMRLWELGGLTRWPMK